MIALIHELKSDNKHLRRESAISLGLIGDQAAVDSLTGLLTHPDKYLRRDAAIALTRINDPRSAHLLIRYILNSKPFFCERFRIYIAKLFRLIALESRAITVRDNYNWRQ